MSGNVKWYHSGVACVHINSGDHGEVGQTLAETFETMPFAFALVYFSKSEHAPESVIELMADRAPGLPYAACSTAGEITPLGLAEGGLQIILFPATNFAMEAIPIAATNTGGFEAIASQIAHAREAFAMRLPPGHGRFAISLMDGMSYMEESITAAVHWGLYDVPLLGGSAGDDLNFAHTVLISNGRILASGAIVILVSTSLPLEIFKTENFVPTSEKLVVTRSDPARRVVYEFNAAPAADAYAAVIGVSPSALTPQSFASHPLVMRVGGEYYCRSIQKMNADRSLSFFCAIDDGIVLTVAEPMGMGQSTADVLAGLNQQLGGIDFILGFDCVLRKIDARNRQATQKIAQLYQQNNVIGFNTYGEQYRSLHLNQTLTGVAFGRLSQDDPTGNRKTGTD